MHYTVPLGAGEVKAALIPEGMDGGALARRSGRSGDFLKSFARNLI